MATAYAISNRDGVGVKSHSIYRMGLLYVKTLTHLNDFWPQARRDKHLAVIFSEHLYFIFCFFFQEKVFERFSGYLRQSLQPLKIGNKTPPDFFSF